MGLNKFTFHYGSILILKCLLMIVHPTRFTFHYGSILIVRSMIEFLLNLDLHSTMVLF